MDTVKGVHHLIHVAGFIDPDDVAWPFRFCFHIELEKDLEFYPEDYSRFQKFIRKFSKPKQPKISHPEIAQKAEKIRLEIEQDVQERLKHFKDHLSFKQGTSKLHLNIPAASQVRSEAELPRADRHGVVYNSVNCKRAGKTSRHSQLSTHLLLTCIRIVYSPGQPCPGLIRLFSV